jgi:hypothetical protein
MSITWDRGFHPDDAAYFAAVGFLCHQWNSVEETYHGLPCDIMGVGRQFHTLLFRHFGIRTVGTFLTDYAKSYISDAETIEQIKHVNAFVERCRTNRNIIVHGLVTDNPNTGMALIRTREDKNRSEPKHFVRSLKTVRRCCDDCEQARNTVIALQCLVVRSDKPHPFEIGYEKKTGKPGSWREMLLAKPPLPHALGETPFPGRQDGQTSHQPSQV